MARKVPDGNRPVRAAPADRVATRAGGPGGTVTNQVGRYGGRRTRLLGGTGRTGVGAETTAWIAIRAETGGDTPNALPGTATVGFGAATVPTVARRAIVPTTVAQRTIVPTTGGTSVTTGGAVAATETAGSHGAGMTGRTAVIAPLGIGTTGSHGTVTRADPSAVDPTVTGADSVTVGPTAHATIARTAAGTRRAVIVPGPAPRDTTARGATASGRTTAGMIDGIGPATGMLARGVTGGPTTVTV